jgi:hypothetical protein
MKKLHQYMMILLAGVLGACSSMSVDDPYVDSYPAGFSALEYMSLHPELRMMQYRDYASDYNTQLKENLGDAAYNAQKSTDEANLLANTEAMQAIYFDKYMAGGTAEQWAAALQEKAEIEAAKAAVEAAGGPTMADSVTNAIAGKKPKLWNTIVSYVTAVNLVGVDNDFAVLTALPVDEDVISQQFLMFGRTHGFAYRACRPDELANVNRVDLPIYKQQAEGVQKAENFVADTNLYCQDEAGTVRVIAQ